MATQQATAAAAAPGFLTWGLDEAKKAVGEKTPKDFKPNHDVLVEKKFWRDKKGWRMEGPPAGHPQEKEVWSKIEALYTPRDVLGRSARRRTNALLKHEPQVGVQLIRAVSDDEPETPPETELKAEADSALSAFWDRAAVQAAAKAAARATCWAGDGERGYAFLRWWIPQRHLAPGGDGASPRVQAAEVPEAFTKIEVAAVLPNAAAELVDEATGTPYVVLLDGEGEDQSAEIYYVDGEETVILRLTKSGPPQKHTLLLGGLLPIVRVEGHKFVNEEVLQQQDDVNTYNTCVKRGVQTASFPERYIIDAQPSGKMKRLPPGEPPEPGSFSQVGADGATYQLVPEPRVIGASTTTELHSTTAKGAGENVVTHQASVQKFEPTDPEYMTKTTDWAVAVVLDSVGQGHVVNNSSALPSGKSRREARAEFEAEVQELRESIEKGLRIVLLSALFAAEGIASKVGRYTATLRITVDLHVDIGPPLAEDIQVDSLLVDKGYLSRETAMARAGVEDIRGEIERIDARPEAQLERRAKLASTYSALRLAEPSAPSAVLAKLAGYTAEEADSLFGEIDAKRQLEQDEDDEIAAARKRAAAGAGPPSPPTDNAA
jgi:hypothetical protein